MVVRSWFVGVNAVPFCCTVSSCSRREVRFVFTSDEQYTEISFNMGKRRMTYLHQTADRIPDLMTNVVSLNCLSVVRIENLRGDINEKFLLSLCILCFYSPHFCLNDSQSLSFLM